jgi:hypothetical protein
LANVIWGNYYERVKCERKRNTEERKGGKLKPTGKINVKWPNIKAEKDREA